MTARRRIPRLFGGEARTRLLAALVVDGPRGRRSLATRLGIDPTFALQRLRSLGAAGLVVRDDAGGAYRFAWENPLAPYVARVLAAYLNVAIAIPPIPHGPLPSGHLATFERVARGRLLVALVAYTPTSAGDLAAVSGLSLNALRSAAQILERARIIRVNRGVRPMTLEVNPAQVGYAEVRSLLFAIRRLGAYR